MAYSAQVLAISVLFTIAHLRDVCCNLWISANRMVSAVLYVPCQGLLMCKAAKYDLPSQKLILVAKSMSRNETIGVFSLLPPSPPQR